MSEEPLCLSVINGGQVSGHCVTVIRVMWTIVPSNYTRIYCILAHIAEFL